MSRCARCEKPISQADTADDIALCPTCRTFDTALDSVIDGLCLGGAIDDDIRAVAVNGSVKAVRFW